MDPNKSIQLQMQVRNNAEELQDYLKDLNNWEEDMKKKDQELKNQSIENADLPPIRSNTTKPKVKKKKSDSKNDDKNNVKQIKRIPGSDYNAWDKFDADKALSEVDNTVAQDENSSDETENSEEEELEIMRLKQKAILDKDRGNQYFKNKNYDQAIACYTSGIESDPSNALLPANRAMALIKKGQFAAAEKDCDLSLSLDPTYIKTYHRRGTARFGLKKYELAKEDFEKLLSLDPDNKEGKQELKKISMILASENQQSQSTSDKPTNAGTSDNKTSKCLSSKNQATNDNSVNINNNELMEVDTPEKLKDDFSELNKGEQVRTKKEEQEKGMKEQEIGMKEEEIGQKNQRPNTVLPLSNVVTPIYIPPHLRSKKPMIRLVIEDVDSDSEEWLKLNKVLEGQSEASSTIHKLTSSGNITYEGGSGDYHKKQVIIPSSRLSTTSPTPPLTLPGIPLTSYQFLADWKELKNWPELLCDYIKQIPPDRLPKIFKQSLESEIFSGILRIMAEYFIPKEIDMFSYLKYLTQVGRFSTLVMFLSEDDSKVLNALFKYLKSLKRYPDEDIRQLSLAYCLP